jgi:hypothetical protein
MMNLKRIWKEVATVYYGTIAAFTSRDRGKS